MKLFSCTVCKQLLFFENVKCSGCGHALAYLPEHTLLSPIEAAPAAPSANPPAASVFVALAPEAKRARYRLCANSIEHGVCNWAVPEGSEETLCASCRLNTTIPNLAEPPALEAWHRLEVAKRRMLYTVFELGLPFSARGDHGAPPRTAGAVPHEENGLRFAFKGDQGPEKVFTGHDDGLITINIAEADDPFREKIRQQMGETYRTLLGHFRHEVGHYYWDRLVAGTRWLEPYRDAFGDERADYAEAGKRHYEQGAPADWPERFVSAYASMHPWEDWAETFAHYLHMVDTLGTARSYGLALRPAPVGAKRLPEVKTRRVDFDDFGDLTSAWFPLSVALNSLNRSMGLTDVYPFVLSERALKKLRFVHDVIEAGQQPKIATGHD